MPKPIITTERPSTGRPKSSEVKDHFVTFRVTAAELYQLLQKARAAGLGGAGEYARSRALRGIARRKEKPATQPIFGELTRDIFHELRRQGVNLNQIARHCNRERVPPPPELSELAAVILALWQRLLAR
jgi:hypothetical protein